MNILPLLAALLPWAGSPADALFRMFAAVSLLSIEMQVVTLAGVGSLYSLPLVNVIAAALIAGWQVRHAGMPRLAWLPAVWRVAPWPGVLALGGLVLVLAAVHPLQAADPYHLEKADHIRRVGTLDYNLAATAKINVLGWVYELLLADVGAIPVAGPALLRLHGVFGLLLYLLAIATARAWLPPAPRQWPWLAVLAIPVVFHQFVLVKNDLFIAVPAFVTLLWLVERAADNRAPADVVRAGWLIGFVVGCKLTNASLALILAGGVLLARRRQAGPPLVALALGGLIGAVSGGLVLSMAENARWYGDALASRQVAEIGNVNGGVGEAVTNLGRFAISLFDLGQLTGRVWPGRGGWGGTFGLPFVWALAVLAAYARGVRAARWTLAIAGLHFLSFAAVFPDADLAHRLVLASGMLVVVVAVHLIGRDDRVAVTARWALVPVLALSAAQIARSAFLYLGR